MTALPVVLSTHPLHPRAAARLEGRCDLRIASALDAATLAREGREADVIIVRANLPAELFAGVKRLRAAVRHGAGLDMIPLEAATAAGVLVANVPGVNAQSVAEYVVFAALALARRYRNIDSDLRERGWEAGRAHSTRAEELQGRTLGLIGMGNVGRAVASIARNGFGMRVIAHTPRGRNFPAGVESVGLDDVFRQGDVVVVACPLTVETRGLVDARLIALMQPSAVIINVGRGAIIDDEALLAALMEERVAGAALDVFAEQPLRADHAYFSLPHVVLTPHLAGITDGSMQRMGIGAVEETLRILNNELPRNFVNPQVESAYRKRFPIT